MTTPPGPRGRQTLRALGTPGYFLRRVLDIGRKLPQAWLGARRYAAATAHIHTFCLFLGYPRSGHSLVGALLDAHPQIVMAHELHVLRYVAAGFSRGQLFALLIGSARAFAQHKAQQLTYNYWVPGQWQGRWQTMQVIGDKVGWGTTLALAARPWLLARLRRVVGVRLCVLHVIRHPLDTIARMAEREGVEVEVAVEHYFALCATIARVRRELRDEELRTVYHEELVADPQRHLRDLCAFLGVTAPTEYLADCAAIVFPAPRRSRDVVVWTPVLLDEVARRMREYDFLQRYSLDGLDERDRRPGRASMGVG